MSGRLTEVLAAVGLVAVAVPLLPVAALIVEALAPDAAGGILALHVVLVMVTGAIGGAAWPAARRGGVPASRRALAGGAAGLLAALVAAAGWWVLLGG